MDQHSADAPAVGATSGGSRTHPGPEAASESTRLGTYLRRLREGYGYTLRKVEERATALGEAIDNSQLSRFEKGKAVPSFDKLRALGRVFNVPGPELLGRTGSRGVPAISSRDSNGTTTALLKRRKRTSSARGEHGRAVRHLRAGAGRCPRAETDPTRWRGTLAAEARWRMASALKGAGQAAT